MIEVDSEGFVLLHRKIIKNPIFKKPHVGYYFIYCLLKANYEDKKIIWNKKEFMVERGSFITGLQQTAMETGLSVKNIRTAQQTLENLQIIEKPASKQASKFSYITICNYDNYQLSPSLNRQANRQANGKQTASSGQQLINNKELIINNNNIPLISPIGGNEYGDTKGMVEVKNKDAILDSTHLENLKENHVQVQGEGGGIEKSKNGHDLEVERRRNENEAARRIFNFWNTQDLMKHKTAEKHLVHILARLREGFAEGEIIEAIKNYNDVIASPDCYWTYKWPLDKFMKQSNGIEQFLTRNKPLENFAYIKDKEIRRKVKNNAGNWGGHTKTCKESGKIEQPELELPDGF